MLLAMLKQIQGRLSLISDVLINIRCSHPRAIVWRTETRHQNDDSLIASLSHWWIPIFLMSCRLWVHKYLQHIYHVYSLLLFGVVKIFQLPSRPKWHWNAGQI